MCQLPGPNYYSTMFKERETVQLSNGRRVLITRPLVLDGNWSLLVYRGCLVSPPPMVGRSVLSVVGLAAASWYTIDSWPIATLE